jgi:hypothetical protein
MWMIDLEISSWNARVSYRKIRSAITMTAGAVRCVISESSRSLSRTQRVGPPSFDSTVCCGPTGWIEPDCPRPVRRGLRFFADRIRRSEFARAVMTHAPGRRNSQCARFHGERVSGALLPWERKFRLWPRSLCVYIVRVYTVCAYILCVCMAHAGIAQQCVAAGSR